MKKRIRQLEQMAAKIKLIGSKSVTLTFDNGTTKTLPSIAHSITYFFDRQNQSKVVDIVGGGEGDGLLPELLKSLCVPFPDADGEQ